jgi:hypothetical protein
MGKYRNAVSDDVDSDRAVTRFAGLRMSNVVVSYVYFSRLHPRELVVFQCPRRCINHHVQLDILN